MGPKSNLSVLIRDRKGHREEGNMKMKVEIAVRHVSQGMPKTAGNLQKLISPWELPGGKEEPILSTSWLKTFGLLRCEKINFYLFLNKYFSLIKN